MFRLTAARQNGAPGDMCVRRAAHDIVVCTSPLPEGRPEWYDRF